MVAIKPNNKVNPNEHRQEYKDVSAHKDVAQRCVDMARLIYETNCSFSNEFYKAWPDEAHYVRLMAPYLMKEVKSQMVDDLANPSICEETKAKIYEALVLDKKLGGANTYEKI